MNEQWQRHVEGKIKYNILKKFCFKLLKQKFEHTNPKN